MVVNCKSSVAAIAVIAGTLATSTVAYADGPYLVGFVLYRCTSDGTAINDPYFYTSNANAGGFRQTLTSGTGSVQTSSISFALSSGNNTFTFETGAPVDPGEYAGVQLYFNSTGTAFDPTGTALPGLAAFLPTGSSSWAYVPAATEVINYGDPFGPLVSYGGATSLTIGDYVISLTALEIDHQPAGSLTLSVTPVPAPAVLPLLALAGIATRRRR